MFCCALLCVLSSFAIISMWKRELVVLLCLYSWCLALPRDATGLSAVCDCGIPDHTHLLFFIILLKQRYKTAPKEHTVFGYLSYICAIASDEHP